LPTCPPLHDIPAEELEEIFGAGSRRFQPSFEVLEDRQLLSASAVSTLGGVTVQFSLDNTGNLQSTGAVQTSVSGVQGLYQGQDSTAHQVAFDLVSNYLNEFTPNQGWVGIGGAGQVAQDHSGAVFFTEGTTLFQATGVPTGSPAGWTVVPGATQGLYQSQDASGNPVVFRLANGNDLQQYDGAGNWVHIGGADKVAQDRSGAVFFTEGSTLFQATGVPTGGAAGWAVVAPSMQGLYQGSDASGNPVAFLLQGGRLQQYTGGATPASQVGHWYDIGGDLVITSDGSAWFLGTDNQTVYQLSPGQQPQAKYTLSDALASMLNAGFSVDGASLQRSNDGTVSVSFTAPVEGTDVEFDASYNPNNGQWSIAGTYYGDIEFGWLVLSDPHFQLTNDYLEVDCQASVFGIKQLANANLKGQIYSNGNFTATVDAHALQLGGFTLSNTYVTLTNINPSHLMTLHVTGDFDTRLGLTLPMQGYIDANGNYDWTASHDLSLGGFSITSGTFELSNSGLRVSGSLQVPGMASINVSGWVNSDGTFSLTNDEAVTLNPLGFSLLSQQQDITLTNSGLIVNGSLSILNWGSVNTQTSVNSDGTFTLNGSGSLSPLGFPLGNAQVTASQNGLTVSGSLQVPGVGTVGVSGSVTSSGTFSLGGSGDLYPLGFHLAATTVTLNNSGLKVGGDLSILNWGSISVTASVNSNGTFTLTGNGSLSPFGYPLGSAYVNASQGGLTVGGSLQVAPLGSVSVSGSVSSNGNISLTGSNDLGSVTVSNSGVSAHPNLPVPQPLQNTPLDPGTWNPSNW
jgi:hypothetical protein